MKKQKRDGQERAFNHGYKTAIQGRHVDNCPHESESMRFQWVSGWREGRQDHWDGYTGVAGLHKVSV